ncbi:hypothetical protein [Agrobacterium rosae]|uniref:hypothetical protein n=1 Tax=Agrobacterium rosae TaxID=1972867 RepID=UPI003BA21D58
MPDESYNLAGREVEGDIRQDYAAVNHKSYVLNSERLGDPLCFVDLLSYRHINSFPLGQSGGRII